MVLVRYRRSAILASRVAFLVGALVAVLITTTSNASGTSRGTSQPPAFGTSRATVLIRPVLCFAYPYAASQSKSGPLPACGAPYKLTRVGLNVQPMTSPVGYVSNNVAADPALAGYPSTSHDTPNRVVLLGGLPHENPGERYLLGPSEMRLSAGNVESAVARQNRTGQWVVNIHLSPAGAGVWDRIARQNFHQLLAFDMGGKVVSAPLIQPAQVSFTSFNGSMEIAGSLTAANARAVATAAKG